MPTMAKNVLRKRRNWVMFEDFLFYYVHSETPRALSFCFSLGISAATNDCAWVDWASARWCLHPKWRHHRQVAPRTIFAFRCVFWRGWTLSDVALTWHGRSGPWIRSSWRTRLTSRGQLPGWLMNLNCIDYWIDEKTDWFASTNERR